MLLFRLEGCTDKSSQKDPEHGESKHEEGKSSKKEGGGGGGSEGEKAKSPESGRYIFLLLLSLPSYSSQCDQSVFPAAVAANI